MAGSNASNQVTRRSVGRPTKFTPDIVKKLEEAFAIGASDKEACFYANVAPSALYTYQEKHPQFVERKTALKERPILMARQKVLKEIDNDVKVAMWYLERKRKGEFALRTELTGADGKDLPQPILGVQVVTDGINEPKTTILDVENSELI